MIAAASVFVSTIVRMVLILRHFTRVWPHFLSPLLTFPFYSVGAQGQNGPEFDRSIPEPLEAAIQELYGGIFFHQKYRLVDKAAANLFSKL